MAVCNLFNKLSKPTGNFLMFSQYVEDLTKCMTQNEAYRVVPSKFIVANIDYKGKFTPGPDQDFNDMVSEYFQNYFENSCAYLRDYKQDEFIWTSENSKNLFWKSVIDTKNLFSIEEPTGDIPFINEIRYIGDINIQSYDEHAGMGYSEIFCHIPSSAAAYKYNLNIIKDNISDNHITYPNDYLMGYNDKSIGEYSKDYYPYKKYDFLFENGINPTIPDEQFNNSYTFNTIILLYDIKYKSTSISNEEHWIDGPSNIPMGIYFTGNFEGETLTNPITKFISDSAIYGNGTSYGLRICTRFTVTPESSNINIENIESNNVNYSAFCEAMSKMSENSSLMTDIAESQNIENEKYKDLYSIFKNSRTNVPYTKYINGKTHWFVNGRDLGITDIIGRSTVEGGEIFNDYINNKAIGKYSHAEGQKTFAAGESSHAECENTQAIGDASHAEGLHTQAIGDASHAEGSGNKDTGYSKALGHACHAEGGATIAGSWKKKTPVGSPSEFVTDKPADIENYDMQQSCHAEGWHTQALRTQSHAEGYETKATGLSSHAEGHKTTASGEYSHTEGYNTTASNQTAHAEGLNTIANNIEAHAEGYETKASGQVSHAEGYTTLAEGQNSHAEGRETKAIGNKSHAEGEQTTASGNKSHAEGWSTIAGAWQLIAEPHTIVYDKPDDPTLYNLIGNNSHAEGNWTIAIGNISHAEGERTIAENYCQHSQGCYNIEDSNPSALEYNATKTAFVIGNGEQYTGRSDAFKVLFNGQTYTDNTLLNPQADYAEMFEWEDKNIDNEDRVGYFVSINKKMINKATSTSNVIGVVSGAPAILGDNPNLWYNKYLNDEWGRPIYEDVEVKYTEPEIQEDGTVIEVEKARIDHIRKINPSYKPDLKYISRLDRPEWDAVGLIGKLLVRQDGTLTAGSYCKSNDKGIATKSDTGYYVMDIINDKQALILFK